MSWGWFEVIWHQVSTLRPNNLTGVRKSQTIKDERVLVRGNSTIRQQTVGSCFLTPHINWFSTHTYTRTDGSICLATISSFWVSIFSHLSYFGLLERVSRLSGSDSFRPSCTKHRWHFFSHLFLSIFFPFLLLFPASSFSPPVLIPCGPVTYSLQALVELHIRS